ncbi:MAG: S41 family peptidase [Bacteroidetes bacterium]|nr:S41 family peptidase [Bacteroidota bacterium]
MNRFLIVVSLFLISAKSFSQQCNCDTIFQRVKYNIENNYAGWFDKIKQFDKAKFNQLQSQISLNVRSITIDSLCFKEIKKYVDYFHDGHLHLNFKKTPTAEKNENGPVVVRKLEMSESEMMAYFHKKGVLNQFEGIWENETYRIGVIKSREHYNLYNGIIIKSKNENWSSGEIKFTIVKGSKKDYVLKFISGDKSTSIENKSIVYKNILDAKDLIMSRVFPEPVDNISLDDYSLETNPTNPKLTFPHSDLAVWTFPNFYSENSDIVQLLLKKYQSRLDAIKYWIIDLRNNEGGDVRVGNTLLPFLYTKPIVWYSEFSRLTEDNFSHWYNTYVKDYIESLPKEKKRVYDSLFAVTKTHFGEFGHWDNENNIADTIRFEKRAVYPEKIVILIDSNTFSSGELFTILARQSDKVVIMGENSAGSIDYGNVVTKKMNCPVISLTFPTSRNNWLDKGISIDRDKVQPDVYIPRNIKDWIAFAYRRLKL